MSLHVLVPGNSKSAVFLQREVYTVSTCANTPICLPRYANTIDSGKKQEKSKEKPWPEALNT